MQRYSLLPGSLTALKDTYFTGMDLNPSVQHDVPVECLQVCGCGLGGDSHRNHRAGMKRFCIAGSIAL